MARLLSDQIKTTAFYGRKGQIIVYGVDTMIKAYLPYFNFLSSSISLGFFVAYGLTALIKSMVVLPMSLLLTIFTMLVIYGVWWMYHMAFKAPIRILTTFKSSVFLIPTSLMFAWPESLDVVFNKQVFNVPPHAFLNANYAVVISLISFVWAYVDTQVRLKGYSPEQNTPVSLWTVNVYPDDFTFEDKEKIKPLRPLVITWVIVGLLILLVLEWRLATMGLNGSTIIIAKIGAMIPTAALLGCQFIFLGQACVLLRYEKTHARTLEFRKFSERLRWRHDYVKYHLPWIFRKLNLRLFNQHIDAYQTWLRQQHPQGN